MGSELRLAAGTLGHIRLGSVVIQQFAHTNALDECHIDAIEANCREALDYVHGHLGTTDDSPDGILVPPEVATRAIKMMSAVHSTKITPRTR